jgi:alpha-amylase
MNETMIQYFHWYSEGDSKLWKKQKKRKIFSRTRNYLSLVSSRLQRRNGGHSIGYDAYDLYDLGEFDQKGTIPTKYGTKKIILKP